MFSRGSTYMQNQIDKEAEKAWAGWIAFTRLMTWSTIAVVVVLSLMAVFLL